MTPRRARPADAPILVLLAALAAPAALGAQAAGPPSGLEATVDSLVTLMMEAEWSRVPGAAVAVVDGGRLVLLEGYGVEDVESGEPVDPRRTLFHVASLSKPITATAVLQLVDEGRLALHGDVSRRLDRVRIASPFQQPVTVAHLLTHTAGFDRRVLGRITRDASELGDLGEYLARRLPAVVRPPGRLSVYSNHGFALAGYLVAAVDDVPFARAMERRVFDPLGMQRSAFDLQPELEAAMATGYGWRGAAGAPEARAYVRTGPASMLRTTAADLSLWMRAILSRGVLDSTRVLSEEGSRRLLRVQHQNHRLLPGRSYGLSQGGRFDPPSMIHSGGVPGFTSALVLHEGLGLGIAVLLNSRASPWRIVRGILERYEGAVARAEPPVFLDGPVPTARLSGFYRSAEMPHRGPVQLGALVEQVRVRSRGPGRIAWNGKPYRAVDSLAFRREGGDAVVAFVREGDKVRWAARSGDEYERVGWGRSRPVQAGLWLAFVGSFLGGGLAAAIRLARRRQAAGAAGRHDGSGPEWPLLAAGGAAVLDLLFVGLLGVGLAQAMGGGTVLDFGLPGWLQAAFVLPLPAGLLALAGAWGVLRAWREGWGSRLRRVALTVLVAALAAFVPFLASWGLLGPPG